MTSPNKVSKGDSWPGHEHCQFGSGRPRKPIFHLLLRNFDPNVGFGSGRPRQPIFHLLLRNFDPNVCFGSGRPRQPIFHFLLRNFDPNVGFGSSSSSNLILFKACKCCSFTIPWADSRACVLILLRAFVAFSSESGSIIPLSRQLGGVCVQLDGTTSMQLDGTTSLCSGLVPMSASTPGTGHLTDLHLDRMASS